MCWQNAIAQDIYDLPNSKKYARFLLQQKQYTQAAEEWENILKREKSDTNNYLLLHTYRLGGMYNSGENFAEKHFSANPYMATHAFTEEYVKTLLQNNSLVKAQYLLVSDSTNLDTSRKADYTFQSYILHADWQAARKLFDENKNLSAHKDNSYQSILLRAENQRHKNPALATTLSVVIPGLGKVYTEDWKDGAVAFFLVSSSALQAYWGFREKGTSSVYGWIFGGVALGYYTGNIYGSYKSAKRFNQRQQAIILQDAKRIIFSAY
ncbi:MAG: hypothetical protein ACXWDO_10805 [Bacteroidia bacterium]